MTQNTNLNPRVCHSIAGRVRLKSVAVRSSAVNAKALERFLTFQGDIRSARVKPSTGSIIVHYDASVLSEHSVAQTVLEGITELSRLRCRSGDEAFEPPVADPRWRSRGSLASGVLKVLAFTGFTAYYLARTWLIKSPLKPGWMTAATVIGSLPLFRRAIGDLLEGRLNSVNLFLASGRSWLLRRVNRLRLLRWHLFEKSVSCWKIMLTNGHSDRFEIPSWFPLDARPFSSTEEKSKQPLKTCEPAK